MKRWMGICKRGLVLAAISVTALAACGGGGANGEARDDDDFKARLSRIVEDASEQYGALAERAGNINPNEALPDDFKAEIDAVGATARRAADAIDALSAPQSAVDLVDALVAALRARADAFEGVASQATVTLQEVERDAAITKAGEQLDRALRQLRDAGFLREEEPHD